MIPTMTPRLAPEAACGSDSIGFTDVLVDSLTLLGLVVSATKEGSVALLVGIPVIGGAVGSVAVEVGGVVAVGGSVAVEVGGAVGAIEVGGAVGGAVAVEVGGAVGGAVAVSAVAGWGSVAVEVGGMVAGSAAWEVCKG